MGAATHLRRKEIDMEHLATFGVIVAAITLVACVLTYERMTRDLRYEIARLRVELRQAHSLTRHPSLRLVEDHE